MRDHFFSATPKGARLFRGASQAVLLSVALIAASAAVAAPDAGGEPAKSVPAGAAPAADPLAMDSLLDQPGAEVDLTAVDPAGWTPDHAVPKAAKPDAPAASVKSATLSPDTKDQGVKGPGAETNDAKSRDAKGPAKDPADNDVDPEPDTVVIPSSPPPSNDPLDRPHLPTAAKVTPSKVDPAKADPAKSKDPKAATAKPDATKPGTTTDDPTKPAADAAAPAEPLPPLNAAIKAALDKRAAAPIKGPGAAEKRKEREAVNFFYAAHGFAPAWSEKGKAIAAVEPVLARLAKAGEDALTVPDVPNALKTDGSIEDIAASELALTEAVVAYARQATGARIEPRSISPLIGAKPQLADPAEILDGLTAAGPGAGDRLAALNPVDPRYVALREKLAEIRGHREPAADKDEKQIPDGPLLKVGMRDSRVPLLRARLDVQASGADDDADLVFDAELSDAVKGFQRQHGIPPFGMLGGRTLAALNARAAAPKNSPRLEAAIVANMEMWRWMPHEMGRERIEVNIPDYQVTVFHDNEPVAKNRVVVGKTETPTPIFSNTMKYLIVNPVWNVPQSIIKNEFGGEARGFKARYVHGQLYLQQPAGPGNALGRIKFMFPNDYSVYLHDTPSKHLFANAKRAYSHGCVRVDKPFEFAESILNDAVPEGGKVLWSQQRLQKMLGTTERYVNLPTPLPIHIEYFTASIDGDRVNLREDIYGYAGAVAASLGYGKSAVPVATPKSSPVAERKARSRRVATRRDDDDDYPRRSRTRARARPRVEVVDAPASRPFFMPW